MTTTRVAAARSADPPPCDPEAARRDDGGDADSSQRRRLLLRRQQQRSLQDMREYLLHEYPAEPPPPPGAPARRVSYDIGYHLEAQLNGAPAADSNRPRRHSADVDHGLISDEDRISDDVGQKEPGRRELQRGASQRIRLRQMLLDESLSLRLSNSSAANNSMADYADAGSRRGIKGRRKSSAGQPIKRSASNGGSQSSLSSFSEGLRADSVDDKSISSEDLQFDNALRLNNRRDSAPDDCIGSPSGTPGSCRFDSGEAEIVEGAGASRCATVRFSNSADDGSITKSGNADDNSLTLDDLKFDNARRRRASMPNIGGCDGGQDKINPYSILVEDLKFDNARRRSMKCNDSSLDEDLKFDNARRHQNGYASVPNIGGYNYDTNEDDNVSIMNEDLQFDNSRRGHVSMPNICMDESNHSTNSSSIMAEHIALKLKVAELQSELHQTQEAMKQLRQQNDVLQRRNAKLEEQNYSYKKRFEDSECQRGKPKVIDDVKALPGAEEKRLKRRESRSEMQRNGSWKKPELDWGPLNESDRTPTLESRTTTTAKDGAEAAGNAATKPDRRDKLKRRPSYAQAWWNRSALRRQDSLMSVATANTNDMSSHTGSNEPEVPSRDSPFSPNPCAPPSSGQRQSPIKKPTPRSTTSSDVDRHRTRSKSWNLGGSGEEGSDRGHDILCHSTRTRRRRGAGGAKDDGDAGMRRRSGAARSVDKQAEVPAHVEIPDLPYDAVVEDEDGEQSDLSEASASRPEGRGDGTDGAGAVVAGGDGGVHNNPRLSLVLLKPWQMMTKKGFG